MGRYIIKRLLQTIPMLFILSIVLFALVNLAPGGPIAGRGQSRFVRPEQAELLKRQFGLDKPLPVQYIFWLVGNDWTKVDSDGDGVADSYGKSQGVLRGDFGNSFRTRQPVMTEIAGRLPNTIYLMSVTLIIVALIPLALRGVRFRPLGAAALGHETGPWLAVALPIGISFFTFHKISYIVDVYRGLTAPAASFELTTKW